MARKKGKKGKMPAKTTKSSYEKPQNEPELVNVSSVALQKMFDAAMAADEILFLQQRIGTLRAEKLRLLEQSAERESQQEAVFATLRRRVADAHAEIQALAKKTRENEEKRHNEHKMSQKVLQERLAEMKMNKQKMAGLEVDLRERDKALELLVLDVRESAISKEQLAAGKARLKEAELMLETFRRQFTVIGRAGVGGKGMIRFPEDVALARDALALLGHIASLESLGSTFLTADGFYQNVVEVLERHASDRNVAIHASRLLHKTALQGQSQAESLRKIGVIPLLAEALADAAYGQRGARRPRRLHHHAFETMRLCYPSGFFNDSVEQLRLSPALRDFATASDQSAATPPASSRGDPHADPLPVPRLVHDRGLRNTSRRKVSDASPAIEGLTRMDQQIRGSIRLGPLLGTVGVLSVRDTTQAHLSLKRSTPMDSAPTRNRLPDGSPQLRLTQHKAVPGTQNSAYRSAVRRKSSRKNSGVRSRAHSRSRHASVADTRTGADSSRSNSRNGYWDLFGDVWRVEALDDVVERKEGIAIALGAAVLLRWPVDGMQQNEKEKREGPTGLVVAERVAYSVGGSSEKSRGNSAQKDDHCGGNNLAQWRSTAHPLWVTATSDQGGAGMAAGLSSVPPSLSSVPSTDGEGKFRNRWTRAAPPVVAFHALICLLRAAEVDIRTIFDGKEQDDRLSNGDRDQVVENNRTSPERRKRSSRTSSSAGGARAVVMEDGVLALVLGACEAFSSDAQVVAASCMLLRLGVRCFVHVDSSCRSSQAGTPIPVSRIALLVRNGAERIIRKSAKSHRDNALVITEASALLKTLGMDPLRFKPPPPGSNTRVPSIPPPHPPSPPPPLQGDPKGDTAGSRVLAGHAVVEVDATTTTMELDLELDDGASEPPN